MKLLYLDTETTGISDNSAIVQIAGAIEIDDKVVEWFNIRCKPHNDADISEEALENYWFYFGGAEQRANSSAST